MSVNNSYTDMAEQARARESNSFGASDVFLAGANGVVGMILVAIGFSVWAADFETQATYTTEDELETFNDLMTEDRTEILVAAALLFIALIPYLAHIYYMKLVFENVFARLLGKLCGWLEWMFIFLSIISSAVIGGIIPILLVITVYYDWEFTDSDGDTVTTGYYCQMLLARMDDGFGDVGTYVGGLTTINLFFILACIIRTAKKNNPNNHNALIDTLFSCCGCCPSLPSALYLVLFSFLVLLITFCTFSDVFGWGDSGYFSLSGASQDGATINLSLYLLFCIWLLFLARNFDKLKPMLGAQQDHEYKPIGSPIV